MEKIQKLTADEKGLLHGGFALISHEDIGKTYIGNTNVNCSLNAKNDTNVNCGCTSCDSTIGTSPNEP